MTFEYTILTLGYIFGFYMAWNIGANDAANAMASSVGAKAITIRQALFIAGILNVAGAVFVESHVVDTISKGIVSPEALTDPKVAIVGALPALIAAALRNTSGNCERKKGRPTYLKPRSSTTSLLKRRMR